MIGQGIRTNRQWETLSYFILCYSTTTASGRCWEGRMHLRIQISNCESNLISILPSRHIPHAVVVGSIWLARESAPIDNEKLYPILSYATPPLLHHVRKVECISDVKFQMMQAGRHLATRLSNQTRELYKSRSQDVQYQFFHRFSILSFKMATKVLDDFSIFLI